MFYKAYALQIICFRPNLNKLITNNFFEVIIFKFNTVLVS